MAFARRGFYVVALEPGLNLLHYAQKKLADYPNVKLLNLTFENLPLEDEAFDLVTSATAFHWITPAVRYVKSARALRKTGTLALFWNRHPRPYTGFFEEVQSIYSEVVPEWPSSDNKLTDEAWIQETRSSILASGFFGDVKVRMYPWTRVYGSDDYIRLLSTYSDHITLPEVRRNQLFEGIKRLIDEQFGGSISRPYLSVLFMTHKLES